MEKYYTSPYQKPYIRRTLGPDGVLRNSRIYKEVKPVLRKLTTYESSFSLTPAQRDAAINRRFDGAEIMSTSGNLIIELGRETLRIAALNARRHTADGAIFYVVKF